MALTLGDDRATALLALPASAPFERANSPGRPKSPTQKPEEVACSLSQPTVPSKMRVPAFKYQVCRSDAHLRQLGWAHAEAAARARRAVRRLSTCLSTHPPTHPPIHSSINSSTHPPTIHPSPSPSTSTSTSISASTYRHLPPNASRRRSPRCHSPRCRSSRRRSGRSRLPHRWPPRPGPSAAAAVAACSTPHAPLPR